jgi:DNA-binding protein HU-beta
MNRKELVAALAKKTDSSNTAADRNIAALIEIISVTLKKGDADRFHCVASKHASLN